MTSDRSPESLFQELIENAIVKRVPTTKMEDIIGNYR